MNKQKFKKTSSGKKLRIGILLVVIALLVGIYMYATRKNSDNSSETDTSVSDGINMAPPTDAEKAATEQHKADLEKQQNNTAPASTSGKTQVTPIITSASDNEVRAYVPGIVEEGGTCTATATQGSLTRTGTSVGIDNVSNTQCPPISINIESGSWSVIVSYGSNKAEGTSSPFKVN